MKALNNLNKALRTGVINTVHQIQEKKDAIGACGARAFQNIQGTVNNGVKKTFTTLHTSSSSDPEILKQNTEENMLDLTALQMESYVQELELTDDRFESARHKTDSIIRSLGLLTKEADELFKAGTTESISSAMKACESILQTLLFIETLFKNRLLSLEEKEACSSPEDLFAFYTTKCVQIQSCAERFPEIEQSIEQIEQSVREILIEIEKKATPLSLSTQFTSIALSMTSKASYYASWLTKTIGLNSDSSTGSTTSFTNTETPPSHSPFEKHESPEELQNAPRLVNADQVRAEKLKDFLRQDCELQSFTKDHLSEQSLKIENNIKNLILGFNGFLINDLFDNQEKEGLTKALSEAVELLNSLKNVQTLFHEIFQIDSLEEEAFAHSYLSKGKEITNCKKQLLLIESRIDSLNDFSKKALEFTKNDNTKLRKKRQSNLSSLKINL